MAVDNLSLYTAGDGFGLPLNIRRGNPNPLDNSEQYATLAEAQSYASSDPTAYVGQIIVVHNTDVTDGAPIAYVIQNAAGDLKPIGDASDVFADPEFTTLKNKVDLLTDTDETKEGSLAYVADQSKVTVELDTTVTDGSTNYNIYQGFTITEVPDPSGATDTDGNPVMIKQKTPVKVGTIGINADLIISSGSVVSIINTATQATDDAGNLVYEDDGITPVYEKIDSEGDSAPYGLQVGKYLKLVVSDGSAIYIATADLAKGLVDEIKTATNNYSPDADGLIDLSNLSTDDITPGTVDTWILNGGNATT